MRLGQTSIIHFGSRFLASAMGFVATVFIGRILGSAGLGTYSLVLSLTAWLGIGVTMGVSSAVTKRVSEGEDQSEFAIAGTSISIVLFVLISVLVVLFRPQVNSYIGYSAAGIIIVFLFVNLAQSLVNSILQGQHLVHIAAIFSPIRTGSRSIVQITALLGGLGLIGIFFGYAVGYLVVVLLGLWVILRNFDDLSIPTRTHYTQLGSYAKYSWIGSLRSQAFDWVDVTILGFFVSQSFIGIYTAAWNIAVFLIIFGGSISQTLFPEMSQSSADDNPDEVVGLFETALAFAGLILIPGLVGGTILGEQLLSIYGEEFSQGHVVLSVLIVATLAQGYQRQFTTALNAMDKPNRSFRINVFFIISNVALNILIIPFFGVLGAAGATAISVSMSLLFAYHTMSSFVEFSIPFGEILRQWVAAITMGLVVYVARSAGSEFLNFGYEVVTVGLLVGLGAAVYFAVLLALSSRFRNTVYDNLPLTIQSLAP
jgi:O-antigen/teichoic acid export membrane protein